MLHARPDTAQVDAGDAVERFGRLVGRVGERQHDARVVERHVKPAERVDGAVDERGDLVLVRDVTGRAEGVVPGVGERGGAERAASPSTSASTTAAPAAAKARAVSSPMPPAAPVTRAT